MEIEQEGFVYKKVMDLGAGAYLMMHGYKVVGKNGKEVVFEIPAKEEMKFDEQGMEYLSSPYHHFDSCLMSLKKMHREFHPPK